MYSLLHVNFKQKELKFGLLKAKFEGGDYKLRFTWQAGKGKINR
jgi:hypothetical protein